MGTIANIQRKMSVPGGGTQTKISAPKEEETERHRERQLASVEGSCPNLLSKVWGVSEDPSHRGWDLNQMAKRDLPHTLPDVFKDIRKYLFTLSEKVSVSKTRSHLLWTSGNRVQLLLQQTVIRPSSLKVNGTGLRGWHCHLEWTSESQSKVIVASYG